MLFVYVVSLVIGTCAVINILEPGRFQAALPLLTIQTRKFSQILKMPIKALTFKGDKKTKKRKCVDVASKFDDPSPSSISQALTASKAEDEAPAADDSWVTAEATNDVIGPIIFVLPSEPPTCIACDTSGKVFASLLENIVDEDPSTAEPHDVRQVWVANRVAGTETFSFKGHHGR